MEKKRVPYSNVLSCYYLFILIFYNSWIARETDDDDGEDESSSFRYCNDDISSKNTFCRHGCVLGGGGGNTPSSKSNRLSSVFLTSCSTSYIIIMIL